MLLVIVHFSIAEERCCTPRVEYNILERVGKGKWSDRLARVTHDGLPVTALALGHVPVRRRDVGRPRKRWYRNMLILNVSDWPN